MCKNKLFKLNIVILFAVFFMNHETYGQSSCSTATNIITSTPIVTSTQTASSNEHWVSFVATNDSAYLQCFDDNYGIQQIDIYDGNCGNPTLIATSSNDYIVLTGITVNSSYLVKFTSLNSNGNFKFLLALDYPTLHIERNGSPITAYNNDICIGDQLEVWATWGSYGVYPTSYAFAYGYNGPIEWTSLPMATNINSSEHTIFTVDQQNMTLGYVDVYVGVFLDGYSAYFFNYTSVGWPNMLKLNIQTTPNITFTPSPNPACPLEYVYHNILPTLPYFGDWGDGDPINSAFGTINHEYQQTGNYIITASSTNVCGTESHQETVVVAITPDFEFTNQCVGNVVQFNDLTTCSSVLGEWQWDFGDGVVAVYSSSNSPTHTYKNPGTYNVKLKVKTKYHQINPSYYGNEEEFSINKQITIYPKPEPAVISGVNNNCDGIDDIQYDIDNYQSSFTYNWTITQGSGTFNNTTSTTASGQTNTIDWSSIPSLPAHAQLQIQTTDNNGCQSSAIKNIFECCESDRPDVTLNNETITGNPTTYSGKRIMVNGTLNIDADVIFEDNGAGIETNILMGPEAKIIVSSGHTLLFENSNIYSNCEYMWDGIYASGNTSLIEFDNSLMSEAINGIVVDNAAVVMLSNSDFINNYKSVQVNNYVPNLFNPLQYTGEIYGCNFYTKNTVLNNGSWITPATDADYYLNLAPMTGKQAFAAIMLNKVGLINIGDASKNQNLFAKQQYGVYAETSEPTIRNNEFQYIKKKYSNGQSDFMYKLPESAAIFGVYYYKKFLNLSIGRTMKVGDINLTGGNYSNTFENCDIGIMTKNYRNKIYKNKFLQTSNSAVYMYDMASGGDIQYNYINNNISLPNARGIYGANTTQRKMILNIENNMIYYMKWGVALTNAASFSFPSNPLLVQVHNNSIALNPIDNAKRYAIKVAACDRIEIRENTITRIGNSSSADATKVVGISLRQTQSAKVTDNFMFKMGSGIMTNGAMYNTQFFCNTMSLNYNGFYFGDNTGLTNFGWKNVPNKSDFNPQNKWVNNIGDKMYDYNIISPQVDYYLYDNTWTGYHLNYDPEIDQNYPIWQKIKPVVNNSGQISCTNSNGPNILINDDEITTDAERDELLSEFLEGEEYSALSEEFRTYEIEYLYEVLDNDPNIMWLGGGDDEEYQEFYNEVKNSVNAKFIDVDNYIAEGDFENAYASNTAIQPSTTLETNRQQSNKVYLETYLLDNYLLAESTISSLTSIASQTPYAGGYGVYTARVMLDYDPDQNGIAWRLAPSSTSVEPETQIRIFPNPAKEMLFVEALTDMDDYAATIQIYNTMGQLVGEQQLSQKLEYISLNCFKTGMYFYTIQYSNGYTENGKFMIQQ